MGIKSSKTQLAVSKTCFPTLGSSKTGSLSQAAVHAWPSVKLGSHKMVQAAVKQVVQIRGLSISRACQI